MSLIDGGIYDVRAFGLPVGVWSDGCAVVNGRAALIRWRSSWDDKLYQVYVNGRFAGVTSSCGQRSMVVRLGVSSLTAIRIEVFAVEPEDSCQDFSSELERGFGNSGRVKIYLLADQSLEAGSEIKMYSNNGEGEVNYSEPINRFELKVWRNKQYKAGLGTAFFGEGDFGYDSAAATGLGKGVFGLGLFGLGAGVIEWESDVLESGVYKFGVKIIDSKGNLSDAYESDDIVVIRGAEPAEDIEVLSFDKETNKLILGIS